MSHAPQMGLPAAGPFVVVDAVADRPVIIRLPPRVDEDRVVLLIHNDWTAVTTLPLTNRDQRTSAARRCPAAFAWVMGWGGAGQIVDPLGRSRHLLLPADILAPHEAVTCLAVKCSGLDSQHLAVIADDSAS